MNCMWLKSFYFSDTLRVYIYIYIYVHAEREREKYRERGDQILKNDLQWYWDFYLWRNEGFLLAFHSYSGSLKNFNDKKKKKTRIPIPKKMFCSLIQSTLCVVLIFWTSLWPVTFLFGYLLTNIITFSCLQTNRRVSTYTHTHTLTHTHTRTHIHT